VGRASLPPHLEVLRERGFRLLLGAQGVSMFGDRMVAIALAFAVLELDGTPTDVGLVLAARTFPLVACLLLGGVVADRISRRSVMVVSDVVRLASQGLLAGLLISGSAEIWMLAVLSGVTGAAGGFFNPAAVGLLPGIVSARHLQQANGIRATVYSVSEIAGPLVAGLLVAGFGAGWALGIDAATFAASAAFLAALRVPPRAERAAASFLADLREGWQAFRSRTWVWTYVAWAGAANVVFGAWGVLGPVVADRDLGGAAAWGAILAALGVGALVGAVAAIRGALRRPMLAVGLTAFLSAPALVLLAVEAPVAVIALGALLIGFGMMFGNTVWEATLQSKIPIDSLSRVSAYDWFGSLAFAPIGSAVWGPVAELMGIEPALMLAAGLTVLLGLALLAVPDIRHLRSASAH
jgi:MFS family permease